LKNIFLTSIIIIVLLITTSCEKKEKFQPGKENVDIRKPMSWGHKQKIYVLADQEDWNVIELHLRNEIEKEFFTTDPEKYFELLRADFDALEQFYKFKNLIFCCTLKSHGKVSKFVRSKLAPESIKKVETGGIGMFKETNVWANDQLIIFLAADITENMEILAESQSEKIFTYFKEKLSERIAYQTYKTDIVEMSAFNSHPWIMKIPGNYLVYKDGKNFISYIARLKETSDRYIAVYYEKTPENIISQEWLTKKRNEVFLNYYDGDKIDETTVRFENVKIGKLDALKLTAKWQNEKYLIGGVLQTFAVYDSNQKTAYLIDNSVYFPAGYKLTSLLELEEISHTFETKQLTKE